MGVFLKNPYRLVLLFILAFCTIFLTLIALFEPVLVESNYDIYFWGTIEFTGCEFHAACDRTFEPSGEIWPSLQLLLSWVSFGNIYLIHKSKFILWKVTVFIFLLLEFLMLLLTVVEFVVPDDTLLNKTSSSGYVYAFLTSLIFLINIISIFIKN